MATEQDEQLVQEIIGKVIDLAIKEDENLKISGFEANIDKDSEENKTNGSLIDSPRMDMDDKHTEENETEGLEEEKDNHSEGKKSDLIDAPRLEISGKATDLETKEGEDSKISGFEANIDEHLDEKTDGPLVGSLRMDLVDKHTEEDKTEESLVDDAPRSEISGKVTDLETKEDENLKISGFEANIDEHLDKKTDGPLVGSLRMDLVDKHTEEDKTDNEESLVVDAPRSEISGKVTDLETKEDENLKISGFEANIDEHLDKTDGQAKSAQKARTKFCSLL
uniref:Uncharacterized protein n=1 Tax=Meloidogyne incognita TaxID=6306 RepID=A0A914L3W1_MELIC